MSTRVLSRKRVSFSLSIGSAVALAVLIAAPAIVRAEFFVDLYGGASTEMSGSVTAENTRQGIPVYYERGDFDGSDSAIGGIRGGYWFKKRNWLGIALDISYFEADTENSSIEAEITPITALLMLRYPMWRSEEFPFGRFYPYAGVGLTFAGVEMKSKYGVEYDYYYYDDDEDYGYGTDLRAGINWQVTRKVGLFLEYRHLSLELEADDEIPTDGLFYVEYYGTHYDGDLDASFVLGGLSFHF
jgi:opacity protein-like surface antigen